MMNKLLVTLPFLLICFSTMAYDGSRLWLTNYDNENVVTRIDETAELKDGFRIEKGPIITASTEIGLMYGLYELQRCEAMGKEPEYGDHIPAFEIRLLNHWDNLDGSIERGYAGKSIWKWEEIDSAGCSPALRQHIEYYAKANASIGINGTVLNNVNASPNILTEEYLTKIKVIAEILRPYGIKVYLSVNFASPKVIGNLETADPLDEQVSKWWKEKAEEIYSLIPDFGGFLVKANSEGQPGPGDYGRTHADGANMLADAVKPYGGIIIWRCFVYGNHQGEDRVKQAVSEFKPVDGQFHDNIILQAKNGPLDFQPREPYAPIFDQIKETPIMGELQITQEYLGQSIHLVYLAPMWKEFFSFVPPTSLKGIAGVANIGDDDNWCGHHFSQANWYAFGRLAWNPELSSDSIAKEWLRQTFTYDIESLSLRNEAIEVFEPEMTKIMESSREACVNYMMPLGLHHIFKGDHHYGPEPDGNQPHFPLEWKPVYYHKADSAGIGFDRSSNGTDAVGQYRSPYREQYDNLSTCPEKYLLWFHHLPWTHKMQSGRTLWEEMQYLYNSGVEEVETYVVKWEAMKPYVDRRRWEETAYRLEMQLENAKEWRDTCLGYFGFFAQH